MDKAPRIEFFYDLSSPWTYLAFTNIQRMADRLGERVHFRPMLVGGVFNAVNQSVYASRDMTESPKIKHLWKVLHDWARSAGVAMVFPSPHHPVKSVLAMRVACALEDDQAALISFSDEAFKAYFGRAENLDDPAVVIAAANAAGLDGEALALAAQADATKARLRANTDEVIARCGYGSPTIFVDKTDMYFGNDQLALVEAALNRF
jgi:2-hydroxychromene-2-carboxylate isomerase